MSFHSREEKDTYLRELRDRAAVAAMQGLIAAGAARDTDPWWRHAQQAKVVADRLVEELYPEEAPND